MKIEIVKRPDGSGVLRCTREDATSTWQKQTKQAAHFALHDLTHFAVETVLAYGRGFFGLIAKGWDIEDATGKGSRGPLPPEALEVEKIVGLFDAERGSGSLWSADEFNSFSPKPFTATDIEAVRSLRAKLFRQWFAIPPGEQLRLEFTNRNEPTAALASKQ